MQTLVSTPAPAGPRRAGLAIAALGIAWNLFGIVQWQASLRATPDSLMADGLSAAQAAVYLALPAWMDLAFAVGVFGGLAGSLALALRRRLATPLLALSLLAYAALAAGDLAHGLFDAMPQQAPVIALVLAIATGLLATAGLAGRRGAWR